MFTSWWADDFHQESVESKRYVSSGAGCEFRCLCWRLQHESKLSLLILVSDLCFLLHSYSRKVTPPSAEATAAFYVIAWRLSAAAFQIHSKSFYSSIRHRQMAADVLHLLTLIHFHDVTRLSSVDQLFHTLWPQVVALMKISCNHCFEADVWKSL